jgi:hypothetical protein
LNLANVEVCGEDQGVIRGENMERWGRLLETEKVDKRGSVRKELGP